MELPERSEDDRYVLKYGCGLDRLYLRALFRSAVESVDRAKKEMTIAMHYQTVRAMWRTGYSMHPAPAAA